MVFSFIGRWPKMLSAFGLIGVVWGIPVIPAVAYLWGPSLTLLTVLGAWAIFAGMFAVGCARGRRVEEQRPARSLPQVAR